MPREIISSKDVADPVKPEATNASNFNERLVKLIPSEIVTAYVTIQGLISGYHESGGDKEKLMWIVLAFLFVLTPIYLFYVSNVKKPGQIVFTSIAFLVWVMAVGSPFKDILGFSSVFIGSILLVFYTLLTPLFYKG